ncbi:hypothetical protein [Devosia ginsengisoli]|uniref:Carboxypeptidase regulatory-like domain-containing protein n=1 Tax=Devosia ginsengisoli TaxID=400770 RepID=A0A5B8LSL5_9HYPH|nr:hypothetical protein [Devosia ginsengisoli]QDZ11036.1 hypothetical protein FPZ08_09905 [Devosia ginsengisoli]
MLTFLVSACTSLGAPVVLTASFDPHVASFINESGSARISGQAFVRRNSGKLLRAVGTDVFLVPRTPYADERIAAIYGDYKQQRWGVWMPDADPLYEQYMRKTIASSGGSFSFNHVADGEYYVVAMIHLPSDYSFHEFPVIERVSVQGGESVRLVMRGY